MLNGGTGPTLNEVQLITVEYGGENRLTETPVLVASTLSTYRSSFNAFSLFGNKCKPKHNRCHKHKTRKHACTTTTLVCSINTFMYVNWINLVSFLPLTLIVKVQVALFYDWSTAVYVIT